MSEAKYTKFKCGSHPKNKFMFPESISNTLQIQLFKNPRENILITGEY